MMAPRTWVILGAAAAAGVALYVWRKGGIANAAASVTTAAADAGAGVVLGTGAGSNTSEPPPYWDVNAINGEGSFWPMP